MSAAPDFRRICREQRASEAGTAFRGLLRETSGRLVSELIRAEGPRVHQLQGAILALNGLLRDIETDPAEPVRRDGAYV